MKRTVEEMTDSVQYREQERSCKGIQLITDIQLAGEKIRLDFYSRRNGHVLTSKLLSQVMFCLNDDPHLLT